MDSGPELGDLMRVFQGAKQEKAKKVVGRGETGLPGTGKVREDLISKVRAPLELALFPTFPL